MKKIEELTFSDDYMFGAVMKDKEICKGVLERLLKIRIKEIEYPELQKNIKTAYETHGIRMDVYVKDSDKVYDIELQNKSYDFLGKRCRFYQSMIDADFLLAGNDYSKLKESMILFICKSDPFKRGLQQYTFENICHEDSSLLLDDKAKKVIYNASGYKDEKDEALQAFLHFVCTNEATDDFTATLTAKIAEIKKDEIFRTEYARMNIAFMDARREAMAEGMAKGMITGKFEAKLEGAVIAVKEFNISPEIAAEKYGIPLEKLLQAMNTNDFTSPIDTISVSSNT